MAQMEAFFETPSEGFLDGCTKEQLLKIADHYKIEISDKRLKDTVKAILKANLYEMDVLPGKVEGVIEPTGSSSVITQSTALTFEQQKELLLLQMEHERLKHRVEIEKSEKRRSEVERELAFGKLRYDAATEQARIRLEHESLRLDREDKLDMKAGHGLAEEVSSGVRFSCSQFDIIGNLRLVPRFNERDPEIFFSLFERVADARGWPDVDRTTMLQCVLTGKAQEAYSALSVTSSICYDSVKAAVLKAYEMVPESYRQRFRRGRREDKQSCLEFSRDLVNSFNRWRMASGAGTFEDLCDLMILEQFKNAVPGRIATYVTEQQVTTVGEAAALADQYELTHNSGWGNARSAGGFTDGATEQVSFSARAGKPEGRARVTSWHDMEKICHFCHKKGHVKADCYALQKRNNPMNIKPAALAASAVCVSDMPCPDVHKEVPVDEAYSPFVSTGYVSLSGSGKKVPVTILRDTGALDSFILASVLPFSGETATGDSVLVLGMGLVVLSAPLHRLHLCSDLVEGEVSIGVRPVLPVKGVHLILGNGLAGGRVWPNVPPLPVSPVSAASDVPDECEHKFPEVFPTCVVTRAGGRAGGEPEEVSVMEAKPIKQRFYRVSANKRKYLDAEIKYMLENNIAKPSSSSWASPCLLVPKSDNTPRFCSDFRKVNSVTKPPWPPPEWTSHSNCRWMPAMSEQVRY